MPGKPLRGGRDQYGGVAAVAFSPDGKLLASAGGDGYVRLWDPATGTQVGKPLGAGPSWDGRSHPNASARASAAAPGGART